MGTKANSGLALPSEETISEMPLSSHPTTFDSPPFSQPHGSHQDFMRAESLQGKAMNHIRSLYRVGKGIINGRKSPKNTLTLKDLPVVSPQLPQPSESLSSEERGCERNLVTHGRASPPACHFSSGSEVSQQEAWLSLVPESRLELGMNQSL